MICVMDDVRDIKNQDQFSRTLDGRVVRTSPFGRNASGEKAYKRAERLIVALHLLTNHVSEVEPARHVIRKKGVQLLSEILELRDEMRGVSSVKTRMAQASIRELVSLVRILTISACISFQNADTVIEALDELGNFLNASRRSTLSEDVIFSRDDFSGSNITVQRKSSPNLSENILSLGANKSPHLSDIKDMVSTKDSRDSRQKSSDRMKDISTRGQNILSVLKTGGELGIKEICAHFPEYSEKMVQRELAFLVASKYVAKKGLKRWSRYLIVQ